MQGKLAIRLCLLRWVYSLGLTRMSAFSFCQHIWPWVDVLSVSSAAPFFFFLTNTPEHKITCPNPSPPDVTSLANNPPVSYRINRRNRFREDGISLLGRDTPAFILDEVRKRQAKDRGTSSLRSKLAADYGWRHANFIVKHGMRPPTSSNDRNRYVRTDREREVNGTVKNRILESSPSLEFTVD